MQNGRIATVIPGNDTYYIAGDQIQSNRTMVDENGNSDQTADFTPYGKTSQKSGALSNYLFSGKEQGSTGLYYFGARYYRSEAEIRLLPDDPNLGRWLTPDPAGQLLNPYVYAGNNPLVFVDPDGEFVWWIPVLIGAAFGGTTGGIIAHNNGQDWWKGAITGAFIGAGIGAAIASGVRAAGIANAEGVTNLRWGITTTVVNSANTNMAFAAVGGASGDQLWKFGLVGAGTGGFSLTGGLFNSVGSGGKFLYQALGTSLRSIGNNWARGLNPFSQVTLGIGPVNIPLGGGNFWRENAMNLAAYGLGFTNAWFFKGEAEWDSKNLTYKFYGGRLLPKIMDKFNALAWTGGSVFATNSNQIQWRYKHELNHLWMSRIFNNQWIPNWLMQEAYPRLLGDRDLHYAKGNLFEDWAKSNAWNY